jgi:hypothetical protein
MTIINLKGHHIMGSKKLTALAVLMGALAVPAVASAHTTDGSCVGQTPTQIRVHLNASSFAASGAGNGGFNKVTIGVAIDSVVQPPQYLTFAGASGNIDIFYPVTNGAHVVQVTDKWDSTDTRDGHSQLRTTLFNGPCSTLPLPPAPPRPPRLRPRRSTRRPWTPPRSP